MTIDEKKRRIMNKCTTFEICSHCPLVDTSDCYDFATDEEIENNYKLMFPEQDDEPDNVNHPNHYNRDGGMECIEEMIEVFGIECVMDFCMCNVWKYRYRAADKNGAEDLRKSDYYMKEFLRLKKKM